MNDCGPEVVCRWHLPAPPTNRGIWYEVYGSNEYQETIHFHEINARKRFWERRWMFCARRSDGPK